MPDDKLDDLVHATADLMRRSGLSVSKNALFRLNDVLAAFLENDSGVTYDETMASSLNPDRSMRFSRYGRTMEGITLGELMEDSDCIARVEQSGSEGFYVEVAQWQQNGSWRRIAFYKSFELAEAALLADKINVNSLHCRLVHGLPDAPVPDEDLARKHAPDSGLSP